MNIVFDEDDSLFERADDRPGPHDVILAAAEAVRRQRRRCRRPAVQFAYGTADPLAAPALAATPTSHIELAFSEGTPARRGTGTPTAFAWLRSQDGVPDLDATGERVRATNVVTMRVGDRLAATRRCRCTVMVGLGRGVGLGGRADGARHVVEGRRAARRSCSRPTTAVRCDSRRATPGSSSCRTRARRPSRPEHAARRPRGIVGASAPRPGHALGEHGARHGLAASVLACTRDGRVPESSLALTRFEC